MNNNRLAFFLIIFSFCISNFALAGETRCSAPMDSTSFATYSNDVAAHDFDDAKIKSIKIELKSKCFSSAQVKLLLELLSFEEDKLAVAKLAYLKVSDPTNFESIFDIFEFDSSKKEIKDFIAASK